MNAFPWHLYRNPYIQLGLTACFITAAELFLKKGAALSQQGAASEVLGLDALFWRATWVGIVFHILGFLSWLSVLRVMRLVEAFALLNIVHVLVPIFSLLLLKETVSLTQWCGIALVILGSLFVGATASRASDAL